MKWNVCFGHHYRIPFKFYWLGSWLKLLLLLLKTRTFARVQRVICVTTRFTTTTAINLCSTPIKYTTSKNGLFLWLYGLALGVCVRVNVWLWECAYEKEATNKLNFSFFLAYFINSIWFEKLRTTNFYFWSQNTRACKNYELFCIIKKKTESNIFFTNSWNFGLFSQRCVCNVIIIRNLCNRSYFLCKDFFYIRIPLHCCGMPIWNLLLCVHVGVFSFSLLFSDPTGNWMRKSGFFFMNRFFCIF